jgi:phytol kinase
MWLSGLLPNPVAQDAVATAITFTVSLLWLRFVDWLVARGWLAPQLSRKIIHIGTGPPYILCWNLFSSAPYAAWLAALVPLAITGQFVLVGFGWLRDDAAVRAITRTGNRREMLRGPLLYGLAFVVCTVVFWRHSPLGILALMLLCGGDGLADIAGRRYGARRLPFNNGKSWAGSAAMFGGGFIFSAGFVLLFAALGKYALAHALPHSLLALLAVALAATLAEALPLPDIDNFTVTATALLAGYWLL